MSQSTFYPLPVFARRLAALFIFAGTATLGLQAQQPAADSQPDSSSDSRVVADLNAPPVDLATLAGATYSSSSTSIDAVDPGAAGRLDLAIDSTQPPPRRRYGRPRYNDNSHNPDGSPKYAFVIGGGLTVPTGNTHKYLTPSYAFQVGAGRNFNKNFALMVQFDYDHFGFQGQTIYNQTVLYNFYAAGISGLDGSSHVWSFSLDPVYNFHQGDTYGAYVVGGVGFFHKTANFTVPGTGEYCDPYYGCYEYSANETFDKYTSNAPGFDGGFGMTYKASRFSGERLFVEARYTYMINSQRTGVTVNTPVAVLNTYTGNNAYPANSNRTSYAGFKAGIRF